MAQVQVPLTPEAQTRALAIITEKTSGSALAYYSRKTFYLIAEGFFFALAAAIIISAIALPSEKIILSISSGPTAPEMADHIQKLVWTIKGIIFTASLFPLLIAFLIGILRRKEKSMKEIKDIATGTPL